MQLIESVMSSIQNCALWRQDVNQWEEINNVDKKDICKRIRETTKFIEIS